MSSQDHRRRLGMFAKAPQPGQVKTRLAATLSDQGAADIYSRFLQHLLARLSPLGYCKTVAYWPPGQAARFADFEAAGWQTVPQCPGDLGPRISEFFRQHFAAGDRQVVLIGSDSPDLPLDRIEAAFAHLQTCEVVLGPSHDGGYYLIGMSKFRPELFVDIPWSGPQVFAETVSRLQNSETPHAILEPWYDVDDRDDLKDLLARLSETAVQDHQSRALRESLLRLLPRDSDCR